MDPEQDKLKKIFGNLPNSPGIYIFKDKNSKPIYIGKAKNLKARLKAYLQTSRLLGKKTISMLRQVEKLETIPVQSEIEALLLEAIAIKKFQPKYNTVWKDDKSYLYIKISVGEEVPLVTTTRREKGTKDVKLFGPFPSAATVKSVLRILRHIFPYCTEKHPRLSGEQIQKRCLYCHLGLCPFPWESKEKITEYRETIKKIILFLQGKKKKLVANLKKEMSQVAKKLEFEKAAKIKNQIEDLEYITFFARGPEEYLSRPDLVEDITAEKVAHLVNILALKKTPKRIECYDISNIGGKLATGSLVVFEDGASAKNWYRRFRINTKATPNDVAMLKEVLIRRFKNDWPLPDLIVVDGGRSQLNTALEIVKMHKLPIKVIAIAKRFEQLYTAVEKKPLTLELDNPGLQLIQNLRDEAHRFAITYHRKLRHKDTFDLLKKRVLT